MTQEPLYKLPIKLLSDLASSRALERILLDAAASRGQPVESLDVPTLEQILKNDVYKRLQQAVPAPLAKKRVTEVLVELSKKALAPATVSAGASSSPLLAIEDSAKRFTLYFDWPEAQRLRGVLALGRAEEEAGRTADTLVQEGRDLLGQMERKLSEGLVAQAQDLAEIKATFPRVQGMGGRDVRRLESLIAQIDKAQEQAALIPGEVERARNLAFKLHKALETSIVESSDSAQQAAPEAQARVLALEQEHVGRQLTDLSREFASLLRAHPELKLQNAELRQSAGQLTLETVEAWRGTLEQAQRETLAEQRGELAALEIKLTSLPLGASTQDIQIGLDVARYALESGNLATDELRNLQISISALSCNPGQAGRILEQQRELFELERSAREVQGAEEELRPALQAARDTLASGHELDLTSLWASLERRMGQAAQQREDFDARADHVVQEYDKVRSLAGETTQRLGRIAETLRAQRRLGPMSAQARERYAQTLTDAEALLAEAHAEYQVAQEVTSAFGQDALSSLLDVFDFGDTTGNSLVAAPAPTAPKTSVFDSLLSAQVAGPNQPNSDTPKSDTPRAGKETDWGPFNAGYIDKWTVHDGQILGGEPEQALISMAALLGQADRMGLQRIDMGDGLHVWSARLASPGQWRLARARNWEVLDASAGNWLDTGAE